MTETSTTIVNRLGLHARAATALVNCASGYESDIWLQVGEKRVNGKSIMGVLTLAATRDSEITIQADGNDAREAAAAIRQLIDDGFNEDE